MTHSLIVLVRDITYRETFLLHFSSLGLSILASSRPSIPSTIIMHLQLVCNGPGNCISGACALRWSVTPASPVSDSFHKGMRSDKTSILNKKRGNCYRPPFYSLVWCTYKLSITPDTFLERKWLQLVQSTVNWILVVYVKHTYARARTHWQLIHSCSWSS